MLATGKSILDAAKEGNYAVGAFNINNMEFVKAIIAGAEELQAPIILQTSEGAIKYAGIDYLSAMVRTAAAKASVPIALHLDHGTTYETIISCIRNGWTSVMIDGSHFPLKDNIAATGEIVKIAHACGVSVEAELGRLSGVEDNISVDDKDAIYTNPDEAVTFVKETGVDSLAIAIGTAHGQYKAEPKLDFDRLSTIKSMIPVPIVLHGASGVSEEDIKTAVSRGVNKINIDTDLRLAYTKGLRDVIVNQPDVFDPRKLGKPAMENITEVVKSKITLFGSKGKA